MAKNSFVAEVTFKDTERVKAFRPRKHLPVQNQ